MTLTKDQLEEISQAQSETFTTKRPTVLELENILYDAHPVLDHGFVRVVDYMGNDNSIVQAARVSYGRGTKKKSQDAALINYLMRHRHSTPFEMCEIKLHIKLPIFVARQWIRHRTANVNEYSARYSILDKEFYLPKAEHLASQSHINNQGRGETLQGDYAQKVLDLLKRDATQCYDTYEYLLNDQQADLDRPGLARELARMNLPVNFYTQWYWKIDLHNLMHFLALRGDPHAQYEIVAYADVMLDILKKWVPLTYDAFMDYKRQSVHLSGKAIDVIRKRLKGENITEETSGMSKREWDEMIQILERA
ncbi:MAG: FAD-dependent thymidylate synthase [Alphaproteobacteria bacterium]|nr:FAD-dependent thymidylate synthase [Alphaproteobacteria bacterium]